MIIKINNNKNFKKKKKKLKSNHVNVYYTCHFINLNNCKFLHSILLLLLFNNY